MPPYSNLVSKIMNYRNQERMLLSRMLRIGFYRATGLAFLFTLMPCISLANALYFPILQDQSQEVEWNCDCQKEVSSIFMVSRT